MYVWRGGRWGGGARNHEPIGTHHRVHLLEAAGYRHVWCRDSAAEIGRAHPERERERERESESESEIKRERESVCACVYAHTHTNIHTSTRYAHTTYEHWL